MNDIFAHRRTFVSRCFPRGGFPRLAKLVGTVNVRRFARADTGTLMLATADYRLSSETHGIATVIVQERPRGFDAAADGKRFQMYRRKNFGRVLKHFREVAP